MIESAEKGAVSVRSAIEMLISFSAQHCQCSIKFRAGTQAHGVRQHQRGNHEGLGQQIKGRQVLENSVSTNSFTLSEPKKDSVYSREVQDRCEQFLCMSEAAQLRDVDTAGGYRSHVQVKN